MADGNASFKAFLLDIEYSFFRQDFLGFFECSFLCFFRKRVQIDAPRSYRNSTLQRRYITRVITIYGGSDIDNKSLTNLPQSSNNLGKRQADIT